MTGTRWAGVVAAAAALLACRAALPAAAPTKLSKFACPAWGVKLDYPAGWRAEPGVGLAPLVVKLSAPDTEETTGSGATVVAFLSSRPLAEVAAAYRKRLPSAALASDAEVDGRPARAFEYDLAAAGATSWVRTVIVPAREKYFILTFASYRPQLERTRPSFRAIERSVRITED